MTNPLNWLKVAKPVAWAKKADIKLIDWIQRKMKLSDAQRELLHEAMAECKDGSGKVDVKKLLELARDIISQYPNK